MYIHYYVFYSKRKKQLQQILQVHRTYKTADVCRVSNLHVCITNIKKEKKMCSIRCFVLSIYCVNDMQVSPNICRHQSSCVYVSIYVPLVVHTYERGKQLRLTCVCVCVCVMYKSSVQTPCLPLQLVKHACCSAWFEGEPTAPTARVRNTRGVKNLSIPSLARPTPSLCSMRVYLHMCVQCTNNIYTRAHMYTWRACPF